MKNIGSLALFQDNLFIKRLKITESGCWEYDGFRDTDGYGQVYRAKTRIRAHRYAYELFIGPIPKGKLILHSCDNPPCCNPNHLSIGTQDDNMKDAAAKQKFDGKFHAWIKTIGNQP